MPEQPDNLILEHLRPVRGDIARMANRVDTMASEMTAVGLHLAGVLTIQEHDHTDIAAIKGRLDRIEKCLDLIE